MCAIVVVTTVGTEEQAYQIAGELVARRHAACVNIVPGIRSSIDKDADFSDEVEEELTFED